MMASVEVVNLDEVSSASSSSSSDVVVCRKREVSQAIGCDLNQSLKEKNVIEVAECSERWVRPCIKDSSFEIWHGSLQKSARALVIVLKVGSILPGGPTYLFEGCFEGLDSDQVTHPVTQHGVGHHRWLEGPMQPVFEKKDKVCLVTTILQRILEFLRFGFEEVKPMPHEYNFLELGSSERTSLITDQTSKKVVSPVPRAKHYSEVVESSFWHGCLRNDALALVLVLKKGTIVDDGPMFVFEGCYEGLNKDQLTHRVFKDGDGHHRWLKGPLKLVQRKDMSTYVTVAVQKVLEFIGLGSE